MRKKGFALFSVILLCAFAAMPASAQDHARGWDEGHVVHVTEVHTKDGMFNAYINDLSNIWRKFLEARKAEGDVIRYSMYSNVNPREGEPDLYLVVTYANWAAVDRGVEYFDEISSKVIGSPEEMREAAVDRGELRTIGSTYLLREITFKE